MPIRVLAGLGNPGREYEETRHNIGFLLVDAFAKTQNLPEWKKNKHFDLEVTLLKQRQNLHLIKPLRYMNLSGQVIAGFCRYFKIQPEEVLVVHDDITLPVGEVKLSQRAGAGGHNGILDIEKHLGAGFLRYRIGVGGKRHPSMRLSDHVLSEFTPEEKRLLEQSLEKFLKDIQVLIDKDLVSAMNSINKKEK